ncbi:hypothetical protein, conserved [Trypanosoma brucei gambiense DAL972]|uniref:tRNA(Phe) 7-[(3-amino-3-carboxypropyl)-4-demethylwyosine(37)-N(4)]-methyltransferase n=3 Tax=Trypanosoma brucei TaxID=5691 RepID=Q382R4_TRYB2|nr:hypothetical protein, conserved [Trypanosoma brucei gambiense DAL972]XP_829329.1 hypothetical protein, conserved [Trypanosoma brucei brucei TREU927]EAN80217.1 hypothetical protein, conserved [Trypanosoma brucei brucei TREU927]RHW68326.1 Methyltransferase TYW3 [Trypanosoma brucei equiperdum]CBH18294.1 hypothetical protein, conserved [Trypanosoma brucei gambiense DAL972]|eukprot:XP_011780558.1 hypothetical protein, conserved [Trypanosoma brucei gambiense DAL972]
MFDLMADACAAYMEDSEPTKARIEKNTEGEGRERKGRTSQCPKERCVRPKNNLAQGDKEFKEHKQRVMSNLSSNMCDHSPKGGVDRKCLKVMELLNNHQDYVTVSSCSGRIALFHSTPILETLHDSVNGSSSTKSAAVVGKRGSKDALGWLVVKHGELTEEEINQIVKGLCGDEAEDSSNTHSSPQVREVAERKFNGDEDELDGVWMQTGVLAPIPLPSFGTVTLKMEPFVMHVACRTMESGKRLLTAAATEAGFRNSGVTPPGKRVVCAIRNATGVGLDIPLVVDGVNYARGQHSYVRRLLLLANEKMRNNDLRRHRLEVGVAAFLERGHETPQCSHEERMRLPPPCVLGKHPDA